MSTARLLSASAVALALALGSPAESNASRGQGSGGTSTTTRGRRGPAKPTTAAKPVRPTRRQSSAARDSGSIATGRAPRAAAAPAAGRPPRRTARATDSGGPPRLTRDQRFAAAEKGIAKELRGRTPAGIGVEVRTALQQIQISPNNKILGRGPVDLIVRPKLAANATRWQRWTAPFRPSVNKRMMVAVNDYGNVTPLNIESNTVQARALRAFDRVIPVRELVVDILTSKQAQGGLVAAAASIPAFIANPMAGGAFATAAAGLIMAGKKERNTNRDAAFRRTMTWARAREKAGNRPALTEMHNYYNLQLKNTSTRGIGFRPFVERVALEDFDGQGEAVETEDPPPAQ